MRTRRRTVQAVLLAMALHGLAACTCDPVELGSGRVTGRASADLPVNDPTIPLLGPFEDMLCEQAIDDAYAKAADASKPFHRGVHSATCPKDCEKGDPYLTVTHGACTATRIITDPDNPNQFQGERTVRSTWSLKVRCKRKAGGGGDDEGGDDDDERDEDDGGDGEGEEDG